MSDSLDFILRLAIFCIVHSLLAAPRIKSRIQFLTGRPLPGYRFAYNLFSTMLFGWVLLAWQSTSVLLVAPGIWSLIMHGLQFIILWAGFICLRQTGIASFLGFNGGGIDERPTLVTTGCYAVVRHPLYLLGMLFLLFNPVITTRGIVLTLCSSIYFLFGALLEEHRMIKYFGNTYRSYQKDVPFLLPRLNLQISPD